MRAILDAKTVGLALLIVAVWALVVVVSGTGENWFSYKWDFENTGQFGDSFGSLSAIMASLAALSALATFRATQQEFDRIKSEDAERKKQEKADREQAAERQRIEDARVRSAEFERTFFQLVDSFTTIVAQTDFINQSKAHAKEGRDAFKAILGRFEFRRSSFTDSDAYLGTFQIYKNDLGHYFRFLYHIILFVDGHAEINRYFYVRLIRALLSESELSLIALNCLYGEGQEKFKPLVEKYSLLHNLSSDARSSLKLNDKFKPTAFDRVGIEAE